MGRHAAAAIGPLLGLQFAAIAVGATTNAFFLTVDEAWTDNSLLLALRTQSTAVALARVWAWSWATWQGGSGVSAASGARPDPSDGSRGRARHCDQMICGGRV